MKRSILLAAAVMSCASMQAQNVLRVFPEEEVGPIAPMNGVGGGPSGSGMPQALYKAAGIPFARLHDIGNTTQHCVEVMHIFPDFNADENKAENYDFTITDQYIARIVECGTEIIYRLKNTGHEPTLPKKYGAWPPKDFAKWARICEHIVRHYNDGWANGFHYGIKYWEIWNEPDMDQRKRPDGRWRYEVNPHSWGGTLEQYYQLFATTFRYLKKTHPDLLLGGPAHAEFEFNEPFIKWMTAAGIKVDFFTWHRYSRTPERLSDEGRRVGALLEKYGWGDVPTILDEWNYNYDWTPEGQNYSMAVRNSIKGAAYTAAVMCHMQCEACTDILTYYDFRNNTTYNGAFDRQTHKETATYWPFWIWSRLAGNGIQVKAECPLEDIYVVASRSPEGNILLFVVRYNDDDAVFKSETLHIPLPEGSSEPLCLLTDNYHVNCAYPFPVTADGLELTLESNSFVYIKL